MMTATRMTGRAWDPAGNVRAAGGPWVDLGHFAMKRLRRSAISLLDMRTEFEVVAPGATLPGSPRAGIAFATMSRARRLATILLDPWTEFEAID